MVVKLHQREDCNITISQESNIENIMESNNDSKAYKIVQLNWVSEISRPDVILHLWYQWKVSKCTIVDAVDINKVIKHLKKYQVFH